MNSLTKFLLLFSFLSCTFSLTAQKYPQKRIIGVVVDSKDNPIDGALIWLIIPEKEQPIAQAISDSKGHFQLNCMNQKAQLMVTCLGYTSFTSTLFDATNAKNFHTLILKENVAELKDIVVKAKRYRPIVVQKAGKQIFNVENSINAQGSNAYEILKQVPGITVNDGNHSISLNGRNGILIMLNEKPTYMQNAEIITLLKSTSSNNIKSIEIMQNAPAQYDAAGSGGILNIVLKRSKQEGYNLTLNTGIAYWFNPKQNTEILFNYHHKKINIYGNYSHILGYTRFRYGGQRKQYNKYFEAVSKDTDKRNTASGSLGVDFEINKQQKIGIQFSDNSVFGPGIIHTNNEIYRTPEKKDLLYAIYSESDYYHQVANRYNLNFNYKYEVEDKRSITFDFDYNSFKSNQKVYQPNTYYSPTHQIDSILNYRTISHRKINLYAFSANYEEKLGKGKLMTGAKYVNVDAENDYSFYQIKNKTDLLDKNSSNDFHYTENILAGFLLYDFSPTQKWQFNIGLRLEYTYSKGHLFPPLGSTTKESLVKRDYIDFFPSMGISYKPSTKQTLALSYGKRIDRPAYSDLNPIKQPLDGLTSWKGNPFLEPQKSHRISLHYQYDKTSAKVSYARTNDYRVGIIELEDEDRTASMPKNLGTQRYWGFSLSQSLRLFKAWDLSFSGTVYHLDNELTYDKNRFYHRKRWAGNCSFQTSFPLFWDIQSELSGVYSSKRLGGSTDIMHSSGSVNLGFQKKFLNDKLIAKISMTDLFWNVNWDSENHFDHYDGIGYGYLESRMVKFNLTFKLGSSKKNFKKKSQIQSEINRL